METQPKEQWKLEQHHLQNLLAIVQRDMEEHLEDEQILEKKVQELYDEYRKGKGELYDTLVVNRHILAQVRQELEYQAAALSRPYFGKIIYDDHSEQQNDTIYIGKHGLTTDTTTILVADWRAPVATIYYDCSLGEGSYTTEHGTWPIRLDLKRTLEIRDGMLDGFYDSEAVTNDELLIQYLSQNKEAVLGDIITTIQKEQNQIIRHSHLHNVLVQGAAGSGKTTVALHRISFLLYNYAERYKPSEFCILGSSDILLNYITSGLPDLDVHDIRSMPMVQLFDACTGADLETYEISESISAGYKIQSSFAEKLERFMEQLERRILPLSDVAGRYGTYMSASYIQDIRRTIPHTPIVDKIELFNSNLSGRISLVLHSEKKTIVREERRKYRNYYKNIYAGKTLEEIYLEFLYLLLDENEICQEEFQSWHAAIVSRVYDIYDLCALSYIKHRIYGTELSEELSQVFIDEAQDFGVSLYYLLKEILYDCCFTIMGDISQNIREHDGLESWEALMDAVFHDTKSNFFKLLKSYRNTIEISKFANRILERAVLSRYPTEPIIRHGIPVQMVPHHTETELLAACRKLLDAIQEKGYQTIAIITHDETEAHQIQALLAEHITLCPSADETRGFQNGIQVIPLSCVKGLEFDVVLLWDASDQNYGSTSGDAKRLYVACTRALHELYIMYTGNPALLLTES